MLSFERVEAKLHDKFLGWGCWIKGHIQFGILIDNAKFPFT